MQHLDQEYTKIMNYESTTVGVLLYADYSRCVAHLLTFLGGKRHFKEWKDNSRAGDESISHFGWILISHYRECRREVSVSYPESYLLMLSVLYFLFSGLSVPEEGVIKEKEYSEEDDMFTCILGDHNFSVSQIRVFQVNNLRPYLDGLVREHSFTSVSPSGILHSSLFDRNNKSIISLYESLVLRNLSFDSQCCRPSTDMATPELESSDPPLIESMEPLADQLGNDRASYLNNSSESVALEGLLEATKPQNSRRKKKCEVIGEAERQEARRHLNKMAARRCRKKKFDRIAQLEEQIKAVAYQICQIEKQSSSEGLQIGDLLKEIYVRYSDK